MSSSQKSFLFALVMCLVFGFALTLASQALKDRQQSNVLFDQQKNILDALGMIPETGPQDREILERIYDTQVQRMFMLPSGELSTRNFNAEPVYVKLTPEGEIDKYAVPFAAYGLWSWIYGYIALDGDGKTIAGYTVYSHGETPGLGGEAEKPWFKKQFQGKKIVNQNGNYVGITVVKGKVEEKIAPEKQENYVDGISGATITGAGITKHLTRTLKRYEPLSKELRNENVEIVN